MILLGIFCFFTIVCSRPHFKVQQLSVVNDSMINEVSGLAASRKHDKILYVNNDSGDGPYIYAINAETGQVESKITINGASHTDWEDMAYGACRDNDYCIYVGDFGGNLMYPPVTWSPRNVIYRIVEPSYLNGSQGVNIDGVLHYTWEETNCETLMIDPQGELYLVSKNTGIPAKIAHVPSYSWNTGSIVNLTDLASMSFATGKPDPTGGDISPNGTEIVIISVDDLYYWKVYDGDYVTALTRDPLKLEYRDEPQGEAVCWDPEGTGFYTLSEGLNQPIYYYKRLLDGPSSKSSHLYYPLLSMTYNVILLLSV